MFQRQLSKEGLQQVVNNSTGGAAAEEGGMNAAAMSSEVGSERRRPIRSTRTCMHAVAICPLGRIMHALRQCWEPLCPFVSFWELVFLL